MGQSGTTDFWDRIRVYVVVLMGRKECGKLVEAYLTLVRHVSMRPTMTALRAGRAGVDVDPLYERIYTPWRKREA
jgi:hypothetical protein